MSGVAHGELLDVVLEAPFGPQRLRRTPAGPVVDQGDLEAGHQEAHLGQAVADLVGTDGDRGLEELVVGPEPDPGAAAAGGHAGDAFELVGPHEASVLEAARLAVDEREPEASALPLDLGHQLAGQGVDHRRPHPVQPAGGGVGPAAELAPGVQFAEHDLEGADPLLGMPVDGDAAAVVDDLVGAVGVEGDPDPAGVAGGGFVDRVVDELPQQVGQALGAGAADVHAGALADRLQALEHLDGLGLVAAPSATPRWARSCRRLLHHRVITAPYRRLTIAPYRRPAPAGRFSSSDRHAG